jgi:3-oxoacyl-[acyl-carrier-protein] synthase II
LTALSVTGAGVVAPIGIGRAAFLEAIALAGDRDRSPAPPQTFDGSIYPGARVCEVVDFDASKYLGDKGLRPLDRLTKLLVVAARLALDDAGLKKNGAWAAGSPERVGIVVSNAYGSLEAITELDRIATLEDARYMNPSRFPLTVSNSAAGYVSIWEDLRAINVSVSDGNCGALDAVACANLLLEQARADALLVGGAEAMSEALVLAFDRLGALGERAGSARIGEGAALVAIETPGVAFARGAAVLCTIVGYGTAFMPPAGEASVMRPSPEALERAIAEALSDAQADPRDIDLVVSGACGLRVFDQPELLAIRRALGEGACIVAPKVVLGESLGAGGAMGILTALAFLEGKAAAEPGGGRDMVLQGMLRSQPRTALVTSMGYHGNASALVMRGPSR